MDEITTWREKNKTKQNKNKKSTYSSRRYNYEITTLLSK